MTPQVSSAHDSPEQRSVQSNQGSTKLQHKLSVSAITPLLSGLAALPDRQPLTQPWNTEPAQVPAAQTSREEGKGSQAPRCTLPALWPEISRNTHLGPVLLGDTAAHMSTYQFQTNPGEFTGFNVEVSHVSCREKIRNCSKQTDFPIHQGDSFLKDYSGTVTNLPAVSISLKCAWLFFFSFADICVLFKGLFVQSFVSALNKHSSCACCSMLGFSKMSIT